MFKRYLIIFSALAFLAGTMESCFLQKNKCDTCPGVRRYHKVRKNSKGSL